MSKIEWTDATWNPIRAKDKETGKDGWFCVHASEGCRNCYAEDLNQNRRNLAIGNGHAYAAQNRDKLDIHIHEKTLQAPLRWRKPRKVFVCSMTDLFGEFHDDALIDWVFAVMALCPQHTFQVLTKRAERMWEYLSYSDTDADVWTAAQRLFLGCGLDRDLAVHCVDKWPLPNVWLGVSVEDQKTADARVPALLATPAARRFVSYEPALGPVDFTRLHYDGITQINALTGRHGLSGGGDGPSLDQIIFGGESGPNRRPAQMDWGRAVRDQCKAAGVAFFGKQDDKVRSLPDDLDIREWPR
ncbi:MAG: DUF5131 family protein [Rhodospirillales bacterium]